MEAYHETSLSTKNGAHGHAHHDQGGGDIKEADQEMFTDPASCPRWGTFLEETRKIGFFHKWMKNKSETLIDAI